MRGSTNDVKILLFSATFRLFKSFFSKNAIIKTKLNNYKLKIPNKLKLMDGEYLVSKIIEFSPVEFNGNIAVGKLLQKNNLIKTGFKF